MTAGIRRWTRCGKSNHISDRMAAIRCDRSENLGTVADDLLGESRFREMVALAVLLILNSNFYTKNPRYGSDGLGKGSHSRALQTKVDIIYLIRRWLSTKKGGD